MSPERETDHAAKRQHGEHVAAGRDDDLGEHVGDTERDRRGKPGRSGKDEAKSQGRGTLLGDST